MLKLSTVPAPSLARRLADRVTEPVKPLVRWSLGHGIPRTVIGRAARQGDLQGRLITAAAENGRTDRLVPIFDELRDSGTLAKGRFSFMTASHAAVKEVLSSNDFSTGLPTTSGSMSRLARWAATDVFNPVEPPSLLVTEPPDHTRYRKLVTRVFSVRAVEKLRGRTEEIAAELLDSIDPTSPVDLVAGYCGQLPVIVISEILGVPQGMRQRILELGNQAGAALDLGVGWGQFRTIESALVEFDDWLTGHLEHLRRHPGDNLLSQLLTAQEDGVGLSERELKATAGLVLAAGFETTVNLLGNGIVLLREHLDQLDALLGGRAPWSNAVEEVLRYDPPVLLTGRIALRDTEVCGQQIGAGRPVTTVLAAANRDPDVFEDPERFDITRANAREHVSFSAGRHYCLGAQLARMEGEVGLRAVFERFPDLRLEPGARRRDTRILRGWEHLPARLT
ncbi:cytochrome P450 [Nocardioides sp. CER19]|uniref:cytochrome P450 n=1 Tax=Nocardioides sp. CER19 TaxID=3038538 RepID=UPI00244742E2|nr:cytochrome P450 [Nocardioides sp. CER19]MDH2412765.1 cytochrome P450 [Nocardioides sp. CER19]